MIPALCCVGGMIAGRLIAGEIAWRQDRRLLRATGWPAAMVNMTAPTIAEVLP